MTDKQQLSADKIAEIKKNFKFFDRDGNGQIDQEEFGELLRVISPHATNKQIENGFEFIDEDQSGHIDFDEFLAWWETCWWEF